MSVYTNTIIPCNKTRLYYREPLHLSQLIEVLEEGSDLWVKTVEFLSVGVRVRWPLESANPVSPLPSIPGCHWKILANRFLAFSDWNVNRGGIVTDADLRTSISKRETTLLSFLQLTLCISFYRVFSWSILSVSLRFSWSILMLHVSCYRVFSWSVLSVSLHFSRSILTLHVSCYRVFSLSFLCVLSVSLHFSRSILTLHVSLYRAFSWSFLCTTPICLLMRSTSTLVSPTFFLWNNRDL